MKRRAISVGLIFIILFSVFTIQQYTLAVQDTVYSNQGRNVDVGYLLTESFPDMYTTVSRGWTTVNLNGTIGKIKDFRSDESTHMYKEFIEQNASITVEYKIRTVGYSSGAELKLMNGNTDGIVLTIKNNILYYKSSDLKEVMIAKLTNLEWTGIKLICNISDNKVRIMIDGKFVSESSYAFTKKIDSLNKIYFGISEEGTGQYELGTLFIYKGYSLYEDLVTSKLTNSLLDNSINCNLNRFFSARANGNEILDNNANIGDRAVDGDYDTYWESNADYSYNNAAYIVDFKKSNRINTILLTSPVSYNTTLRLSYLNSDTNQWKFVPYGMWISNAKVGDKNSPFILQFSEAINAKMIAVNFYGDQVQPKISEFQTFYTNETFYTKDNINLGATSKTDNVNLVTDGNFDTYWQGLIKANVSKMSLEANLEGSPKEIDKLLLSAPQAFQATFQFKYQNPTDNLWYPVPFQGTTDEKITATIGNSSSPYILNLTSSIKTNKIAVTFFNQNGEALTVKISEFQSFDSKNINNNQSFTATSSADNVYAGTVANFIDGNFETNFIAGKTAGDNISFTVDYKGEVKTIDKLYITAGQSGWAFDCDIMFTYLDAAGDWKIASPRETVSTYSHTVLLSTPIQAKYISLTQYKTDGITQARAISEFQAFNTQNLNLSASVIIAEEDSNQDISNLAIDGNFDTYWQGVLSSNNNRLSFIINFNEEIKKIDYFLLAAPSTQKFKATFQFTYQDAVDNQWKRVPFPFESSKLDRVTDTIEDSNNPYILQLPISILAKQIAVTFFNEDGIEIPLNIAEFQTYYTNGFSNKTEDFVVPDDWDYNDEGGKISVSKYGDYSKLQEYNTFKLVDNSKTSGVSISHKMSLENSSEFKFDIMLNEIVDGMTTEITQNNGNKLKIYTLGDSVYLSLTGVENPKVLVKDYKPNIWYRMTLEYNAHSNTLKPTVNGWSPFESTTVPIAFKQGSFIEFKAYTNDEAEGVYFVDNIRIGNMITRKTIPEPVELDTGEYVLNMQLCTLWREGTHLGWSALDREGENGEGRKPILGWYDEGDPEVVDWEIKWLLEHGVKSLMYCWYRDFGGSPVQNDTIKESALSNHMWDGLFNAKYRDKMKFTIMYTDHWENGGIYSFDDLMNNLMPYWIETFFKNPNYQKTLDNKPILYIYDNNLFMKKIGDVDRDGVSGTVKDVQVALEAMRQATKKAGFNGLVINTEIRSQHKETAKKISECGYDNVFAYSFSPTEDNISNQAMKEDISKILNSQRNYFKKYGNTKVMPTISKMWDSRSWFEVGFVTNSYDYNYKFDLATYKQMAEWIKDEFDAPEIDGSGKKMIMIDNWNEYAEGHYLFPTYAEPGFRGGKNGFGYLDVLREVFGIDDFQHEDIYPLEEGFGPYDKYYPAGWKQNNDPGFRFEENYNQFIPKFDNILGKNAYGGDSSFNKLTQFSNSIDYSSDIIKINNNSSIRINIDAEFINNLKENQKGLSINTAFGSIIVPKETISKLKSDNSLDVVFKKLIDVTEMKKILKNNGFKLTSDNNAFEIRIMQSNIPVINIKPLIIKLKLKDISKCNLVLINDDNATMRIASTITEPDECLFDLSTSGLIGVVNK